MEVSKKKTPVRSPSQSGTKLADGETFPVVGIGASAGGLEAATALFKALPADSGMAFVLVQHLDSRHASALADLLSRATPMTVCEAQDGQAIRPNTVFVIPPATDMTLERACLRLTPRQPGRMPPLPVDTFLTSLAVECGSSAVGVILSGTGSDGTRGMKAIKEAGGITFAQDATATHDGMPRSAIAAGCADFVLAPSEIAAELAGLRSHLRPHCTTGEPAAASAKDEADFTAILTLLSKSSGVDFLYYKHPTLRRRIARRMTVLHLNSYADYLKALKTTSLELETLEREVLIHVTSFFRDPETFGALQTTVLPQLLAARPVDSPLRVWIPGCSSGEEAYSLAICLVESLADHAGAPPPKIFATDVSERAIENARAGVYPESVAGDVSAERLRQFFKKVDGSYQVDKSIRDLCVFARQDITKDPPFSQIDLISCRNVLIYLGTALQTRVFPIFHYALRPGGVLILGGAETVGAFGDLFEPFDKLAGFYRRTLVSSRLSFGFASSARSGLPPLAATAATDSTGSLHEIRQEADRIVLARYAPAGVVIDESLTVMEFRGHTGEYLEPAPGAPTANLLQMAREGLLSDLRAAIDGARASDAPAQREHVRVRTLHGETEIRVEVLPILIPSTNRRYFVVLFDPAQTEDYAGPPRLATAPPADQSGGPGGGVRLQRELDATKSYLQSVIAAKDAANEELRAANEEIVSSNEELQSTNEELETAKEELQATNEELSTVNEELESRIRLATQLSDDLTNLIDSANLPLLIVGSDLRLRRFTPRAREAFGLIPGDAGRLVTDLTLQLNVADLQTLIAEVLESLVVQTREIVGQNRRWYSLSVRPYRTAENRIDGVVLTLVDIDLIKRREEQLKHSSEFTRAIVETIREPLLVLDERLRVLHANRAFYESFQVIPAETEGQLVYSLGNGQWNAPELKWLLDELLPSDGELRDYLVEHEFPAIGSRLMRLNARRLQNGSSDPPSGRILLAIEDITDNERANRALRDAETQMQSIVDTVAAAIVTIDEQGVIQSFNRAAEVMFGHAATEIVGRPVTRLMPFPYRDEHPGYIQRYLTTGQARILRTGRIVLGQRKDNTTFPAELFVTEMRTEHGRRFTGMLTDITERRQLEREVLEAAAHEQQRIGQDLHDTAGQVLTGLCYLARGLAEKLDAGKLPDAEVGHRLVAELESALSQVRGLSKGLVPVDVDANGLRSALGELTERTQAMTRIECVFKCAEPVPVEDNQTATQLFLIAQEAVNNAIKHSGAQAVVLTLGSMDGFVVVTISDNGVGIAEDVRTDGIGLRIMAYRAALLAGSLSIGRAPGQGTLITCRVPGGLKHARD